MKWLEEQLDMYGSRHTKLVTKLTHLVGVPLVIFSILIGLSWFKFSFPPLFSTNFAWILVVVVSAFYIYLDWRIGIVLLILFLLLSWLATSMVSSGFNIPDFLMFVGLFIAGWAVQIVGHYFESKKSTFFSGLIQIVIAPIFLVAEIAVMIGWRKDLHDVVLSHSELHY